MVIALLVIPRFFSEFPFPPLNPYHNPNPTVTLTLTIKRKLVILVIGNSASSPYVWLRAFSFYSQAFRPIPSLSIRCEFFRSPPIAFVRFPVFPSYSESLCSVLRLFVLFRYTTILFRAIPLGSVRLRAFPFPSRTFPSYSEPFFLVTRISVRFRDLPFSSEPFCSFPFLSVHIPFLSVPISSVPLRIFPFGSYIGRAFLP